MKQGILLFILVVTTPWGLTAAAQDAPGVPAEADPSALTPSELSEPAAPSVPSPAPAAAVLTGVVPENPPTVRLKRNEARTVGDALERVCDQAGWSLGLAGDVGETPLSVSLNDVPADEAVHIILELTGLTGELRERVLLVRAPAERGSVAGSGSPAPAPAAPTRVESGTRNVMGSDLTVEADEVVDEAVVVGGNLTVKGHVEGEAVAIGGTVYLEPGAVVDGEAVAIGGRVVARAGSRVRGDAVSMGGGLSVEEGAVIDGDQVTMGSSIGEWISRQIEEGGSQTRAHRHHGGSRIGGAVVRTITVFIVGVLLLIFAPRRTEAMAAEISRRPGRALGIGALIAVSALPVFVFLCITVIGIPVALAGGLIGLPVLAMAGVAITSLRMGQLIPLLDDRKTRYTALLLGCGTLLIIQFVPGLGGLILVLAGMIGAGALVATGFGSRSREPWEVPPDDDPDPYGEGGSDGLAELEADPVDLSGLERDPEDPDRDDRA